ncbi:MAG: tetratricopeptide repeat protein [Bacteroidales bacterium]|nr:tetratricopeptide repeat protein [Bacteroidales bacterium]
MRTLLFLFLFAVCIFSFSSEITDSLELRLKKTEGIERADLLIDLSFRFSAISFEKAYKYGFEALSYSNKINYSEGIIKSYNNIGISYFYQNSYDKAKEFFITALKLSRDYKIPYLESRTLNGLGVVCKSRGDFSGALEYYQLALKLEKKHGKPAGEATILYNLGNILKKLGKYDEAAQQFQQSISILEKEENLDDLSNAISNLGLLLLLEGKEKEALEKFNHSLEIEQSKNDTAGMSRCFHNLGDCYLSMGDYEKSEYYLKKAIEIGQALGNKQLIIISQESMAGLYEKKGDLVRAVAFLESSVEIAKSTNSLFELEQLYYNLFQLFNKNKQAENALKYHLLYTEIKDSVFSRESSDKIMELQTVYETEKKDAEIQSKNIQLTQEKEISRRQQIINYISIGVLLIVSALFVVLLFQVRAKIKANKALKLKNEEISMQKEEIQSQRDEIETQRDQVQQQKEEIEIINKEITSSITYAQLIQSAVLPSKEYLLSCFSDSFVFYLPKDIVSGDFFWIRKIEDTTVLVAADCTGHGVPGGFMSMLGISLLNEIVNENNKNQPNEILNHLRRQVIASLAQSGNKQKLGDGMDISVCCINKKELKLQYAGANNPVYVIKKNNDLADINSHCIVELKPDKMPVGSHIKQDIPFNCTEIKIEENDSVFLFTDGYVDQFGGQNKRLGGRKYMHKTFKAALLEISELPFSKQEEIIAGNFYNWKSFYEQTDDVLVMGVKI